MTKEQEEIAERMLSVMREKENGTTDHVKFIDVYKFPAIETKIAIRALRDDLGLIADFVHPISFRLTEKGWEFTTFDDFREKQKLEKEKEKYDLLTKRWVYKTRYLPHLLSLAALLVSIYTCNTKKQTTKQSEQQTTQQAPINDSLHKEQHIRK